MKLKDDAHVCHNSVKAHMLTCSLDTVKVLLGLFAPHQNFKN